MTSCYKIRVVSLCSFQECIKFDLPVTKYIGIWSATLLILREHIIDNPFTVGLTQIHYVKGDIQRFCHKFSKHNILIPWTVGINDSGFIMPVNHEEGYHIIPLFFQQVRCNTGVYTPR